MSGAQSYGVLLDARVATVPGIEGLLFKEKAGGKSLLSHSIDRFDEDERCVQILLLAAPAVREWVLHDPLTFASSKLRVLPDAASPAAAIAELSAAVVVWHDALRPNWQAALLDGLLRSWVPGTGVLPGSPVEGMLVHGGSASGESAAAPTAAQDVFGGAKAPAVRLQALAELVAADPPCLVVETPQVYDRAALLAALGASTAEPPAAVAHRAGMQLQLFPARSYNFAISDADALHLLRRLLGEAKKSVKDRYGGLGW
jgi:2-C-methyl-D-erythritol 4-phosphate cytidylyltransferase